MREVSSSYTVSLHYDRRLYRQDIAGSKAHAKMLAKQEIISQPDADAILNGLDDIQREIEDDNFPWRPELEDIHMNIERRLFEKIGDTAGRLHTARSRNDQVATDVRMYTRDVVRETLTDIHRLRGVFVDLAERNLGVVMPGYTHMQRAQPVLFSHHMLAYYEMFRRDGQRFGELLKRVDVLPLGSGALAGLPYTIDRDFVARELGFREVSRNSMDAVSDRDFILEYQSAASICMMHISRLSEELIIWSTDEFAFARLSDDYTTGSSIMPQKRNPDFAEIARGKTGRVYGNLLGLLTLMKGLPLTYNRDLQEDKEGLFDTVDTLLPTLKIFADMLASITIDPGKMREAAQGSYVLATDIADYLVAKGMPFREAYEIVAKLSRHAAEVGKQFQDISLETYRSFSELFDAEVFNITVDASVSARDVPGGTARNRVEEALAQARADLEATSE